MPITVDIDVMLARRKMSVGELADRLERRPGAQRGPRRPR